MPNLIKFTLQSPLENPDGAGGYEFNWKDEAFLWGEIKALSGKGGHLVGERRQYQEVTISLIDALGSGACVGWRLFAEGYHYEILAISEMKGRYADVLTRREVTYAL